jgi:hypothetical protein
MDARELFLSILVVLLLFNVTYFLSVPAVEQSALLSQWSWGGLSTLLLAASSFLLIKGVSLFGTSIEFNETGVRMIFGVITILNILFNFQIASLGINVGIGLINPMLELFVMESGEGFFTLIGFFLASGIAISAFVSGLMAIQGG